MEQLERDDASGEVRSGATKIERGDVPPTRQGLTSTLISSTSPARKRTPLSRPLK